MGTHIKWHFPETNRIRGPCVCVCVCVCVCERGGGGGRQRNRETENDVACVWYITCMVWWVTWLTYVTCLVQCGMHTYMCICMHPPVCVCVCVRERGGRERGRGETEKQRDRKWCGMCLIYHMYDLVSNVVDLCHMSGTMWHAHIHVYMHAPTCMCVCVCVYARVCECAHTWVCVWNSCTATACTNSTTHSIQVPKSILTHWGRVMQICVFTLQLRETDDANQRF